MNKKQLGVLSGALVALVLIGAGCTSSESNEYKGQQTEKKTEAVAVTPVFDSANVKEFTMSAKNWQFDPSSITVKKGDSVRIKITSTDVKHSFMLKDYKLNVQLEPGQTQTIEFVADKSGTFQFRCGVPCGDGHRDMTGTLIVE